MSLKRSVLASVFMMYSIVSCNSPLFAEENDSYTKLLIQSNTFDGDTTIVDNSNSNHPIQVVGDVHHSTLESYPGQSSIHFDGDNDYLIMPSSDDWNFGSGDFTIDFWLNFPSVPSSRNTFISHYELPNQRSFAFEFNGQTNNLVLWFSLHGTDYSNRSASWTPTANEWYHIAAVRTGTTVKFFVNGKQQGTDQTMSGALFNSSDFLKIGKYINSQTQYINAILNELRISKGIARWTENFILPGESCTSGGDYNEDGVVNQDDLTQKLNAIMYEYQLWVDKCWTPNANCN